MVDHQVEGYNNSTYHNVYVDRIDSKCSASVHAPAVVDGGETPLSEGQHNNNLLVLVR